MTREYTKRSFKNQSLILIKAGRVWWWWIMKWCGVIRCRVTQGYDDKNKQLTIQCDITILILSQEGNWEQSGSVRGRRCQSKSLNLNWRWWINFIHRVSSENLFWCTKYLYIICKTIQIETSLNEREFYLNWCNSAVFNEWVLSVHITGLVFWYQLAYQIMMKMKMQLVQNVAAATGTLQ